MEIVAGVSQLSAFGVQRESSSPISRVCPLTHYQIDGGKCRRPCLEAPIGEKPTL
jgi:hypothetical protein